MHSRFKFLTINTSMSNITCPRHFMNTKISSISNNTCHNSDWIHFILCMILLYVRECTHEITVFLNELNHISDTEFCNLPKHRVISFICRARVGQCKFNFIVFLFYLYATCTAIFNANVLEYMQQALSVSVFFYPLVKPQNICL